METRSTQDARRDLAALIEEVLRGEHVALTRYGRPVSVVVPPEWYGAVLGFIARTEDELRAFGEWQERTLAVRSARRTVGLYSRDRRVVHHVDGNPLNNDPADLEIREPDANGEGPR